MSWIVLEITDRCNFKCKWCFANSWRNKKPQDISYRDMKKLLRYLSDSGIRQVTLSGGEPTLHPYLKQIVSDAHDYGMVVHMNTNGYFFDRKMAEELYSMGLSQIQVNIDSLDAKKHDRVRGMNGSWHRAVDALKNAQDAGITAACQTVLTKENEDEVLDIFKFARSRGIQRCRTWDMTPSKGCSVENQQLIPSDYIKTLDNLTEYAFATGAKNIEAGEPLFKQHISTPLNVTGGFCVAAKGLYATISNKGGVFFCATIRKPLYNIFDLIPGRTDLNRFHRKKVAEYLRNRKLASECMKCKHISECMGGCYTRTEYSLNKLDYWCKITPSTSGNEGYKTPHPSKV